MKNHILEQKMRDIKLITFDLDDTFWDIGPPIIKAEKETRHWLNEKVPEINWATLMILLILETN